LTYGIILAKNAPQVAIGKEYCARAISTHQWRLFAKMRSVAGYDYLR
jgi:hypothetical protein